MRWSVVVSTVRVYSDSAHVVIQLHDAVTVAANARLSFEFFRRQIGIVRTGQSHEEKERLPGLSLAATPQHFLLWVGLACQWLRVY